MPYDMSVHGPTRYPVHRLSHWKTLGGRGKEAFLYGDWNRYCFYYNAWVHMTKAESHYNYRGTPLGIWAPWHRWQDNKTHRIPGTKPRVMARVNQPNFRTFRELNGRALVCDTFSKGTSTDALGRYVKDDVYWQPIGLSRTIAGYGMKGHRTAYNVMYGDGHVALFGDPQESIIWHTQGVSNSNSTGGTYYVSMLCANYYYGSRVSHNIDHQYVAHSSWAVWHELDVAGRVDVDAK
jgi:prepilin-type processing-associated H-X9-DG protein